MSKLSYFYRTVDEMQKLRECLLWFCAHSSSKRKTEETANTPVINHRCIPKTSCNVNSFSFVNWNILFYSINLKGY